MPQSISCPCTSEIVASNTGRGQRRAENEHDFPNLTTSTTIQVVTRLAYMLAEEAVGFLAFNAKPLKDFLQHATEISLKSRRVRYLTTGEINLLVLPLKLHNQYAKYT